MRLFHFSEEADIAVFTPRKIDYRPNEPAQVWAIDEFHSPHYYFPRDCPRICIWADEHTSEEHLERFFAQTSQAHIIAIESRWFAALSRTELYRYEFDPQAFHMYDGSAGYYTSNEIQKPIDVVKMTNLHEHLFAVGIELRITPSLQPFRRDILQAGLNLFSMIRMKNAADA